MKKTIKSFDYAIEGLKIGLKERNMRIHLAIMILVINAGFYFSISKLEWIAILLTISLVITAELLNTAIEEVVNIITRLVPGTYKNANIPKDLAAGAVLVSAIFAFVIGVIIFLPYILNVFGY